MKASLPALALVGGLLCANVFAQAPIVFQNSEKALRQYDLRTLDSLREACTPMKADVLFARKEVAALTSGYAFVEYTSPDKAEYSIYGYNQDERSFFLVKGQSLGREPRIRLALSLPRDYGRCRIVRSTKGSEQLEILYSERNGGVEGMQIGKWLKEAKELSADTAPCAAPALVVDKLMIQGRDVQTLQCTEAGEALRERMTRTLRRIFN